MVSTRSRKKIYGEVERNWSELPSDILEYIGRKLYYIDQINSKCVCKSWHSVISVPSLKQTLPWLLVFDNVDDEYSCKLADPEYRKIYNVNMSIFKEKNLVGLQIHESKYGWLLMSSSFHESSEENPSSTSLFLFAPFLSQNNFIELPCLSCPFSIATFSSKPSKEDFILLTMNTVSSTSISINTFRLGDGSWKTQNFECDFRLSNVKSMVYSKGDFYCSNLFGKLGTYNVAQQDWTVLPKPDAPDVYFLNFSHFLENDIIYTASYHSHETMEVYMLKSESDDDGDDKKVDEEEEIFLLFLKIDPSDEGRLMVCCFRLDRSQMNWERLHTLNGSVLFLGNGFTSFMKAAIEEEIANRVYYVQGDRLRYCTLTILTDRIYSGSTHYGELCNNLRAMVLVEPPSQLG